MGLSPSLAILKSRLAILSYALEIILGKFYMVCVIHEVSLDDHNGPFWFESKNLPGHDGISGRLPTPQMLVEYL